MSSSFRARITVVFITIISFACSDDESATQTDSILLRYYKVVTSSGSTLRGDFVFNSDSTIARLDWKRETPNLTQGSDVFSYNGNGVLTGLVRSITGLQDEYIIYRLEGERITVSEHFVNDKRLSFIFYEYNEKGQLIHTEESNLIPSEVGYLRGTERNYFYNDDGNLFQIKEYSFSESTAQLTLESTHTFSNFTKALNPLQPIDVLPNIIFQKNLPTTLRIESDGHVKTHSYNYTFRADGFPAKRTSLVNNGVVETLTYTY